MRQPKIVYLSLSMLLSLTACSTVPPATQPVIRLKPPLTLMLDVNLPKPQVETYGDLSLYAIDLKAALNQCNANLEGLREWANHVHD